MKTHLLREGKKPQFLLVEAGDITLTGKDIASLSHVLGKISPFADPNDYTSEEEKIWLGILTGLSIYKGKNSHLSLSVQEALCKNPRTPGFLLAQLDEMYPTVLRGIISQNPSAPARLLEEFAESGDWVLKINVASNPYTPDHLLRKIFNDLKAPESKNVEKTLFSLASNPSLPMDLSSPIFNFFGDYDKDAAFQRDLWAIMAKNPAIPDGLLEDIYYFRQIKKIAENLASNPSASWELLEQIYLDFQEESAIVTKILQNPSVPPRFLEQFFEQYHNISNNEAHWDAIASNPSSTTELLHKMVLDDLSIPKIATNPKITLEIIEEIYNQKGFAEYLGENPSTPPEILEQLAAKVWDFNMNDWAAVCPNESTYNWCKQLLFNIGRNPSTPPELLETISRIDLWKFGPKPNPVCQNINAPVEVLLRLYDEAIEQDHTYHLIMLATNERGL